MRHEQIAPGGVRVAERDGLTGRERRVRHVLDYQSWGDMDSDGVEEDVRRRAHGARSGRRAETHGRDARGESHDGLHGRAGMLPAATT